MANFITSTLLKRIISVIAVVMSIFHLYTAYAGTIGIWEQRAVHLIFILVLAFLTTSFKNELKGSKKTIGYLLDYVCIILTIVVSSYILWGLDSIQLRGGNISDTDLIIGLILIVLIVEATRRVLGKILTGIVVFFLIYMFFGNYIPNRIGHPGFSLERIIDQMFVSTGGILGAPLNAAAVFITIFVIFGAFLNNSGAGVFFSKFALAVSGKRVGGPAKSSVVASALMGTVTGSAVSNVATTGAFTIPVMIKNGYKRHFAGAVEAAASTGGQITPPVMGATVFIIAEYTNIPYSQIIIYAILPAFLYYLSVFVMVHAEARINRIPVLPDKDIPNLMNTLKTGWHYLLALIFLFVILVSGISPMKAGFYTILLLIVLSYFRKDTRMGISKIVSSLKEGALNTITVSTACAAAGIIVGTISLTGLGLKLSGFIISAAGGQLFLALLFTMIASIILGMGMISISAYIILASLAAPALVELGVTPIAAHLFVYFFGILSNVTPPVALASFTAAGIANSDQTKTAFTGLKLVLAAFIIPFMFVFDNRLMLIGNPVELIIPMITAIIGVIIFASGIQGWFIGRLNKITRTIFIAGSLLLIHPDLLTDLISIILLGATILYIKKSKKIDKKADSYQGSGA